MLSGTYFTCEQNSFPGVHSWTHAFMDNAVQSFCGSTMIHYTMYCVGAWTYTPCAHAQGGVVSRGSALIICLVKTYSYIASFGCNFVNQRDKDSHKRPKRLARLVPNHWLLPYGGGRGLTE